MSTRFIGRQKQLEFLEQAYRSDASAFIPIYGRRRVGKSELILQFLKNKTGVYLLGKKAAAAMQIGEFLREAAAVLDDSVLGGYAAQDWRDALQTIVERNRAKKLILVLDEFQWVVQGSPELPSILQELWDRQWRDSGRVMLILCGSFIGFMEREVLGRKSPLFGRRTGQILLRPFGYQEAALFHRKYSLVDQARAYFVCGGIPLYLKYFDGDQSIEGNIRRCFLDEHAPLFVEPDFLLREELREVENYYAILSAIASGMGALKDIAARANLDSRAVPYYLNQLQQLGYIEKLYPMTGEKPSKRQIRYVLGDPLLRFWFRFVYPHTSYMIQMGATKAFRTHIRPHLSSYFGTCFEHLCREAMPLLYEREDVEAAWTIGQYWDKNVQIDVVGIRDDNWTDVGECKWGKVSAPALTTEIANKVGRFPNHRNATIKARVFTRDAVVPPRHATGVAWHCLADLY